MAGMTAGGVVTPLAVITRKDDVTPGRLTENAKREDGFTIALLKGQEDASSSRSSE